MRGQEIDSTKGGRPTCYNCFRPNSHCLCELIPRFEAHCNILILQHPHERRKYYSTARLVTLALSNATLIRGLYFDQNFLQKTFEKQKTYLLYPSRDAQDCTSTPLDKSSTIVVLDGTWSEAGKILHRNPILKTLPCLSFKQTLKSNYRIRKQPKENYLSTIESIGHLLKLNAISSGKKADGLAYDSLFNGFEQMVDKQLAHFPRMHNQAT